jgi:hypothetical protein
VASADPSQSPIVVDGIMSVEKLAELLGRATEYPELDYKSTIDLTTTEGKVEIAKDVGAMQVAGGYIIGGVNNDGTLSGELDGVDTQAFDEASLSPMLAKWIPEPVGLSTRVIDWKGHTLVLIYVARNPAGCVFFHKDGACEKAGKQAFAFYAGDAFWRNGTRSERMTQRGLEEVIARRVAAEKATWIGEQQEIRQREQADLESAYRGRGPLGAVNFDLDESSLNIATLELIRRDDTIALQHLFNDALSRARAAIARGEIEEELGNLLDKLVCLAATLLAYDQGRWFERVVEVLAEIYSMPFREGDAEHFGYSTRIDPRVEAPRVALQVIERVYALGGLAVRRDQWQAVRQLTLQHPKRLTDYEPNWLRHALTISSRGGHLQEEKGDQVVDVSLLSLARNDAARLECLRPDGLAPDDDELLTSIAQFDVLSNIVAIDGAGDVSRRVFHTNFARFYQHRITPIVERLLTDPEMHHTLFTRGDDDLAIALNAIGELARQEGWRFDGFDGWDRSSVGKFIAENLPSTGG